MDSLVKWGLIGGGAYLVLKYLGYDPLSFLSSSVPATTPTSPGTTTTTADTKVAADTLSAIVAKMRANNQDPNGFWSSDVYDFYYQAVRGVSAPDHNTLFPNDPPSKQYSIGEWWSAMSGAGFSGLGVIATRINPYLNPKGQPFGQNIRANASERFNVRFN